MLVKDYTEPRLSAAIGSPKKVKVPLLSRYFVRSIDADRGVTGVGTLKKGVWVEVAYEVYLSFRNAIAAAKADNQPCGLEAKTE